jgi:hypothetical protein
MLLVLVAHNAAPSVQAKAQVEIAVTRLERRGLTLPGSIFITGGIGLSPAVD